MESRFKLASLNTNALSLDVNEPYSSIVKAIKKDILFDKVIANTLELERFTDQLKTPIN